MKKLLIANRGEIALRIIRAAKELGIRTVAVHSQADVHSLHVKFADEDVCIGPPKSADSYLNHERILSAALITGADAIHPGYGFLAENAQFAEKCESAGITFVGPSPEMITNLGDKAFAKKSMQKAGVATIPGSKDIIQTLDEANGVAEEYRYPVIIKAVAGGGGRGMRIVREPGQMKEAFETARNEAKASFNNPDVYMEKYIGEPRHIEVQILGDEHGNLIHLGERDCSIQRRHQKLIEEALSPVVDEKLREKLGNAAIKAAKAVNYSSAGTIEFIFDCDGRFYFMEMNTRIQVEHPVTELVTNVDIIKEQINIAAGCHLSLKQKDVKFCGHAIECRINAEDPNKNFMPSPGEIQIYLPPGGFGVRVDSHAYSGYKISPYYDSLIAKLLVWGKDRDEAIQRMKRALDEFVIDGVKTTIPFHLKVMGNKAFQSGHFSTHFIEQQFLK